VKTGRACGESGAIVYRHADVGTSHLSKEAQLADDRSVIPKFLSGGTLLIRMQHMDGWCGLGSGI